MSRRADPKLIGLFVIGAVAILVAAIVILGSGRFFVPTETFVLFFEDDVAGLNVGAPVTFRGVRIGSVTDIVIRYDSGAGNVLIPVYIEIQPGKVVVSDNGTGDAAQALIEKGLKAQLRTQSFVTGLLSINLDFYPNVPPRLVGGDPRYPEIPTLRSSISELRATFTDLIADLRKLPLQQMITDLSASARDADKLMGDADRLVNSVGGQLPEVLGNLDQAAKDVSRLARSVNEGVPEIRSGTLEAVNRLNDTLAEVQRAVGGIQSAVGANSPLQSQMSKTLSDVGDAANAIRLLAEYLNQNPSALVTGKKPEEK